jgi:hypothetical protein
MIIIKKSKEKPSTTATGIKFCLLFLIHKKANIVAIKPLKKWSDQVGLTPPFHTWNSVRFS